MILAPKRTFLILFLAGFLAVNLHAAEEPKYKRLEDMTSAELKEALRKSHAELAQRTGSNYTRREDATYPRSSSYGSSITEKRTYETNAQSRINMLNSKIRSLEYSHVDNMGYQYRDADRLRQIQSRAQSQLDKIRAINTEDWKTHKQGLDSILREASSIY